MILNAFSPTPSPYQQEIEKLLLDFLDANTRSGEFVEEWELVENVLVGTEFICLRVRVAQVLSQLESEGKIEAVLIRHIYPGRGHQVFSAYRIPRA